MKTLTLILLAALSALAQSVPPGGGKPPLVSVDGSTYSAAPKIYIAPGNGVTNSLSCANGVCTVTLNAAAGANSSGAYASLPAAGNQGAIYIPTDAPYLLFDTGAAWSAWGPLFKLTPPPAASGFTWVNQGGSSVDETQGGMILTVPAASGDNIRGLAKALPSAPYTFTAAAPSFLWLRIVDNGTNRIMYQSGNGVFWTQVSSATNTDFATPDQLLIWGNSNNGSSLDVKLWLIHWKVE